MRQDWLAALSPPTSRPLWAPGSNAAPGSALTAVVRKMRWSQTMGLEWPRPGISALQATLTRVSPFQEEASALPQEATEDR